ncbi:cytochrome P450 2G1-like [Myotis daubentonii]|uniref:cytochrome P450 2G1-like n=1 Tax=Myotis daubentonii TaxID=98922 RepID=UPI002872B600|nr:cytochrome P450 2G1-like [Myotis daubentonii]
MELGEAFTIFLELCLFFLLIFTAWVQINKKGNLPPGPTPLPFLGNVLQLHAGNISQSFTKLRVKYGPVFTVYMGSRPVVVLCGHEAVKEALVGQADEFIGRGKMPSLERSFQGHGVVLANGKRWRILRNFCLTTLWDFRLGRRRIENRIQEEISFLLEEFHKADGAPIKPSFFLSRSVCNVISSILFGSRFDYEDKQFLKLLQMINERFTEMNSPWTQLYDMYSGIMQYLPGRHNRIYYLTEELKDFIASRVKINEASFDPQNPRDFIDCFLIKMHQEKNEAYTEFNLKNLIVTTLNLLFAATDSVSGTLYYGFLLLMKHPEVEAKICEEINHVIGPHRIPSVDDRVKMPYTDAVIHEIQRVIAPLGYPHSVTRDTYFRGYLLPKGTDVFPVLGSVLKDPKYFRYPDAFYPQHFLDEQGHFKKNEAFVPFSSGKRICLGEAMARMELFLYFTSVLQNFSLRPLVPPADIDITPKISGFGNIPPTYELCLVAR